MPQPQSAIPDAPLALIALLVARTGQMALPLAGPDRWRAASGYTMIPASLPGGDADAQDAPADTVRALALHTLGCPGRVVPSACVYGRSARHAIDRLPTPADVTGPLPLLQLDRLAPRETAGAFALARLRLSVYLTSLDGPAMPTAGWAGLLWLAPAALRLAIRGVPLADLLAKPGVALDRVPEIDLPGEAFVFIPGDFGERHLLRIAAKYGRAALFPDVAV